jgi:hypothetical protein
MGHFFSGSFCLGPQRRFRRLDDAQMGDKINRACNRLPQNENAFEVPQAKAEEGIWKHSNEEEHRPKLLDWTR